MLWQVARRAVNQAREQVADSVGVQPAQVIFTSGGSEANNLFIQGAAGYLKPARIIVSAVEHPCVMRAAQELARNTNGKWNFRRLAVDKLGRVDLADVDKAMAEPTWPGIGDAGEQRNRRNSGCASDFGESQGMRCMDAY